MSRLPKKFFARDASELASALIGTRLVRRLEDGTKLSGIIVETEAYLGVRDRASHAFGGRRTDRNEMMYAREGTAYVYFTYGMHYCMNVVCAAEGDPQAVLLRALEPEEGSIETMRALRGVESERLLCSGPARLCEAMEIGRGQNGVDLVEGSELWLESGEKVPRRSVRAKRVGIDYAGGWAKRLLRWLDPASGHVSRPAQGKRSVPRTTGKAKNRKGT